MFLRLLLGLCIMETTFSLDVVVERCISVAIVTMPPGIGYFCRDKKMKNRKCETDQIKHLLESHEDGDLGISLTPILNGVLVVSNPCFSFLVQRKLGRVWKLIST